MLFYVLLLLCCCACGTGVVLEDFSGLVAVVTGVLFYILVPGIYSSLIQVGLIRHAVSVLNQSAHDCCLCMLYVNERNMCFFFCGGLPHQACVFPV